MMNTFIHSSLWLDSGIQMPRLVTVLGEDFASGADLWAGIEAWYKNVPEGIAYARLQNNHGNYRGLAGGFIYLTAYKSSELYGVIYSSQYWNTSAYKICIINNGVFTDFRYLHTQDDSGWRAMTIASGFSELGWIGCICRKIGNIVSVNIGLSCNASALSGIPLICTVPDGYRPARETNFSCRFNDAYEANICISPAGRCMMLFDPAKKNAGTNYIGVTATYFVG